MDVATQGELLNHRRLHCAHVARLKEVRGFSCSRCFGGVLPYCTSFVLFSDAVCFCLLAYTRLPCGLR